MDRISAMKICPASFRYGNTLNDSNISECGNVAVVGVPADKLRRGLQSAKQWPDLVVVAQ